MQANDHAVFQGKHSKVNVQLLNPIPGSRTLFDVQETDRVPGWNEQLQKYTGVFHKTLNPETGEVISQSWGRGENKCFGRVFTAHIKQLTPSGHAA